MCCVLVCCFVVWCGVVCTLVAYVYITPCIPFKPWVHLTVFTPALTICPPVFPHHQLDDNGRPIIVEPLPRIAPQAAPLTRGDAPSLDPHVLRMLIANHDFARFLLGRAGIAASAPAGGGLDIAALAAAVSKLQNSGELEPLLERERQWAREREWEQRSRGGSLSGPPGPGFRPDRFPDRGFPPGPGGLGRGEFRRDHDSGRERDTPREQEFRDRERRGRRDGDRGQVGPSHGFGPRKQVPFCHFFNTPKGCRNNSSCPFIHDPDHVNPGPKGRGRGRDRGGGSGRR
jgi:hypothetical protein